jgi:hypothetical protein
VIIDTEDADFIAKTNVFKAALIEVEKSLQ